MAFSQPPKLGSGRSSKPVGNAVGKLRQGARDAGDDLLAALGQEARSATKLPQSELPRVFSYDTSTPPAALLKVGGKQVSGTAPVAAAEGTSFKIGESAAAPAAVDAAATKSAGTSASSYSSTSMSGLARFDAKVVEPAQTTLGVLGLTPLLLGGINFVGKVIAAPVGWLGGKQTATKIREVFGKPSAFSNRTVSEVLGERATQAGSSAIGALEKPLNSFGEATGYNAYRIRNYTAKAERSLGKMSEAASRLERAASELSPHINPSLRTHIETLTSNAGRNIGALNTAATGEAVSEIEKAFKANGALKKLSKHAGAVHEAAVLATEHSASAVSLGTTAKNLSKNFGKGSFLNAATNTAFVGMDAISLEQTASSLKQKKDEFVQLGKDMKIFSDTPSMAKLAFMDLSKSPTLSTIRSELIKQYASQFGVRALGAAINLRGIIKGRFNQLLWGAQFAGSMAVDGLVAGHGLIDTYLPLNQAFKAGHALSVDDYAALLAAGCKDCMDRKGGAKNPVIHELAEQLANKKVAPNEVFMMSDRGEIGKMIAEITSGNHHEITPVEDAAPAVSFAQKVGGPSQRSYAIPTQQQAGFVPKAAPASFTARENLKPEATAVTPSIG